MKESWQSLLSIGNITLLHLSGCTRPRWLWWLLSTALHPHIPIVTPSWHPRRQDLQVHKAHEDSCLHNGDFEHYSLSFHKNEEQSPSGNERWGAPEWGLQPLFPVHPHHTFGLTSSIGPDPAHHQMKTCQQLCVHLSVKIWHRSNSMTLAKSVAVQMWQDVSPEVHLKLT